MWKGCTKPTHAWVSLRSHGVKWSFFPAFYTYISEVLFSLDLRLLIVSCNLNWYWIYLAIIVIILVQSSSLQLCYKNYVQRPCLFSFEEKKKSFLWNSLIWMINLIDCNSHHALRRVDLNATFDSGLFWRIDFSALTVTSKNILKMPPVCILYQVPSRLRNSYVSFLCDVKFALKFAAVIKHRNTG